MGLYLLDYGAGNVRSLANTLQKLGYEFQWISSPDDFQSATKIIFPGVGAFQSAVQHLSSRGLLEPLREYVAAGRPYFGICIGLQILFESSAENPSAKGLGTIPCAIDAFDHVDKAVPHMGWNTVSCLNQDGKSQAGLDESSHYYFVHSFRAAYDPSNVSVARWVHSTTQYGQEVFVSSIRNGDIFGTQFHPEKSGAAGLFLLDAWLRGTSPTEATLQSLPVQPSSAKRNGGFTKRIIACLDVRSNDEGDLVVTKGDQYDVREKVQPTSIQTQAAGAVRNMGKPVTLAANYFAEGADEICLLNITSFRHSPLHDQPMLAVVKAAAECVFVPLTIGGGIKDCSDPDGTRHTALEVAGEYFRAGADKVSIGSEAVIAVEKLRTNGGKPDGTSAIETISAAYGRQAVVVSIDPRRTYVDLDYDGPRKNELIRGKGAEEGKSWWYQCTVSGGREAKDVSVAELARGVEVLGAGEILVNSIDRDGTGLGFDLDLIRLVREATSIPVVASSGAGVPNHFVEVFRDTGVEAALAAGIFHRHEVTIEEVKNVLLDAGINVRASRK